MLADTFKKNPLILKKTWSSYVPVLTCASILYRAWGCLPIFPWSYEVFRAAPAETQYHTEDIKFIREHTDPCIRSASQKATLSGKDHI